MREEHNKIIRLVVYNYGYVSSVLCPFVLYNDSCDVGVYAELKLEPVLVNGKG